MMGQVCGLVQVGHSANRCESMISKILELAASARECQCPPLLLQVRLMAVCCWQCKRFMQTVFVQYNHFGSAKLDFCMLG